MNINDLLNSSGEEIDGAMENMDVSLNYENPELMSSEFFDSVLSLENNLEDGFFSNFEDDINLSSDVSSHTDEVLSPRSLYSESDKNSTCTETLDESASVLSSIDGFDDPMLMSLLEPIPNVQFEAQSVPAIVKTTIQKQPTKILIQNPNNKKFIAKPMINASQIKKTPLKGKPQILKVQQVNNGRPLLLPLSVKGIKILNTSADVAALSGSLKRRKIEPAAPISPGEDDTNVVSSTNQYPPLNLTAEEKRLLAKEGIQLPSHHPLTKNEERELKRIRRKIRNKISAQDSRKRKKEYVDGLEERIKRGSEENKNLLQRVRELQKQNKTLIAHVSKLQALICNSTTSKATPSTCLMVVLLSALLVTLPNMKLFENKQISTEQEQGAIRRSLLTTEDDSLNMEEFLVFKDDDNEFENKFAEEALDIENSTEKEYMKMLEEMSAKYEGILSEKNSPKMGLFSRVIESVKSFLEKDKAELFGKTDYGGYRNKKGFVEPDVDEYIPNLAVDEDPPSKRKKYTTDEYRGPDTTTVHNERFVSTTMNTNNFGINTKDK
ncbi:cyclic AMP-responsive element-binding protein 3-like protein 1 [Anoplophora glabripennis]|uniref:cyclic AMP-responsive element-binding protein 3-like protein 1 n=1 Tax=Anoplophora glabripennis TaxID=217634 RepID=UPI0008743E44|nr:cyclic AMP-responsive element-binding protein 3-like protein 1 [Anoplophora glabripennis]